MAERTVPAGPPPFLVPFPRNLNFVGPADDLERLHATLQQREPGGIRPAGLTGMGGIGKTQLAVEYVYRFKDAYPDGIFWINAAKPWPRDWLSSAAGCVPKFSNVLRTSSFAPPSTS